MEMDSFDPLPLSDDSNRAHVAVRKRTIGGKFALLLTQLTL